MGNIDDCYQLLRTRANDRGASASISPAKFNIVWPRAELKFFNNAFQVYAATQTISDSISKWMSDPMFLFIPPTGRYNFFAGMSLIHVDSLNGYLPAITTIGSIGGLNTMVAGSGYTNGTYDAQPLTGGTGTGATANITVLGGVVTSINWLNAIGYGYTLNDTLSASIVGGTGFSIKVSALIQPTPYDIDRTEKNKISPHRASTYDAPDREFPIYSQFSNWLQFYPETLGIVQLVYLRQPVPSYWNYTLNGYLNTFTALQGGNSYTNGTYTNVPLIDTSGPGNGALATIVVSGGAVTSVTITKPGKLYRISDILSALPANIGGTGTGFSITVSSITNARPVYNPTGSVQPLWNDNDISLIVDYALQDVAINARDTELENFSQVQSQSKILQ